MKKIILDLCGGSGSWSEPYRRAGYDVRLVTLPTHDVLTYAPPAGVRGILAAPPCTEFSIARTTAYSPRDFRRALVLVDACLRIIRACRLHGSLRWWALENPTGYLRQFPGCPPFTFSPYDYGHPWTKATDLWGYFKKPEYNYISPTHTLDEALPLIRALPISRGLRKDSELRAVTPPGFAEAFFKSNP